MKISLEHFQLFKSECEKQLTRFGLQSWRVYYLLKKLDNSFATAKWNYLGRVATITLATDFLKPFDNLENQIKETALHECLEILLCPLSSLANDRSFISVDFDKEVHGVIRTLEKLL